MDTGVALRPDLVLWLTGGGAMRARCRSSPISGSRSWRSPWSAGPEGLARGRASGREKSDERRGDSLRGAAARELEGDHVRGYRAVVGERYVPRNFGDRPPAAPASTASRTAPPAGIRIRGLGKAPTRRCWPWRTGVPDYTTRGSSATLSLGPTRRTPRRGARREGRRLRPVRQERPRGRHRPLKEPHGWLVGKPAAGPLHAPPHARLDSPTPVGAQEEPIPRVPARA